MIEVTELGKLAHSQLPPVEEEEFFTLSLVGVVPVSVMMDSNSYGDSGLVEISNNCKG